MFFLGWTLAWAGLAWAGRMAAHFEELAFEAVARV